MGSKNELLPDDVENAAEDWTEVRVFERNEPSSDEEYGRDETVSSATTVVVAFFSFELPPLVGRMRLRALINISSSSSVIVSWNPFARLSASLLLTTSIASLEDSRNIVNRRLRLVAIIDKFNECIV